MPCSPPPWWCRARFTSRPLGRSGGGSRADDDIVEPLDRGSLDITDSAAVREAVGDFRPDVIVNAAAYTAVDAAETAEGRAAAWAVNVTAVARLARVATEHRLTLVHVSSDYVFDGSAPVHDEKEPLSPLGVYGQTKAAGDALVTTVPRHYLIRTSWVIGEGSNFVRTMASLAERGVDPSVVDDQVGRLSFASDIAAGIAHLLSSGAEFGTYNLSNTGDAVSWADVARSVFALTGADPARVRGISTAEYFAGKAAAPRPLHSTLDLAKLQRAGFTARPAAEALEDYLRNG